MVFFLSLVFSGLAQIVVCMLILAKALKPTTLLI